MNDDTTKSARISDFRTFFDNTRPPKMVNVRIGCLERVPRLEPSSHTAQCPRVAADRSFLCAARFLVGLFISASPLLVTPAHAFDISKFMQSDDRNAIIRLKVVGVTEEGIQNETPNLGTGFFVSEDGYALTSAHLFYNHFKLADPKQQLHLATEGLTGQIGSIGVAPVLFEPAVKFDIANDLALIKFVDPPYAVKFLPVCGRSLSAGDPLTAIGFPSNLPLSHKSGDASGQQVNFRDMVNMDLVGGMSGGPILDQAGLVIGVTTSGLTQQSGTSFSTSIRFASSLLDGVGVKPNCSGGGQIVVGERVSLLDGFTQYDASAFSFERKSVVHWGDLSNDISAAIANGSMKLFLPYNEAPYPDATGAKGGIATAPQKVLRNTDDCASLEYKHHWFQPDVGEFYCIRNRDGETFSKIYVAAIENGSLHFDWISNARH